MTGTPSVRYSGAAALAKSSGITVKSAEIFMSPVSRMSVTCGTRLQATPRATADRPQQATVPRRGLSDGDGGERVSQADRSRLAGLTGDQAECLRRIITTLTPTASSIKPRPASAPTAAPVFATPSPLPSPSFLPVSAALTVTL